MKTYAGIGSRRTPDNVLWQMYGIGQKLAENKYTLRSGGANGADTYFEMGARSLGGTCEIYSPGMAKDEWFYVAAQFHPKWSALTNHSKALHARNVAIVLGPNLDDPVEFLVCWTRNGFVTGGTGQALRIALNRKIPVFNLYHEDITEWAILGAMCNRNR